MLHGLGVTLVVLELEDVLRGDLLLRDQTLSVHGPFDAGQNVGFVTLYFVPHILGRALILGSNLLINFQHLIVEVTRELLLLRLVFTLPISEVLLDREHFPEWFGVVFD